MEACLLEHATPIAFEQIYLLPCSEMLGNIIAF